MPDIILHHYPESPFSEKIRLLLGYKQVDYLSVIIPMIMPKPELMPLTGGYRKTPVMQIGADIYCDTAIIARVIDELSPANTIYPAETRAVSGTLAHWADTFFFKVSVAVAFQLRAVANNAILSDPDKARAFAADRAELSKGSNELRMPLATAQPFFLQHLDRMNDQLGAGMEFLLGGAPTIADFSAYHCLWFVHNNTAIRDLFDPFANVLAWMERMRDLGTSRVREITGAEALDIAKESLPSARQQIQKVDVEQFDAGDEVEIMPIDYGFNPVAGRLAVASAEELALVRTDGRVGEVAVHFPRLGFQVNRVGG
jgi:glutathione S-transferase